MRAVQPGLMRRRPSKSKSNSRTLDSDRSDTFHRSFLDMGFPEIEAGSEMPMWFIAFYEQYVRQRNDMIAMLKRYAPSLPSYRSQESIHEESHVKTSEVSEAEDFGVVDLEHGKVDPMILKKMSMEITLLEGGILFHSVFVGMTVSITTEGFIVLLIAILFHQTFEGLGLDLVLLQFHTRKEVGNHGFSSSLSAQLHQSDKPSDLSPETPMILIVPLLSFLSDFSMLFHPVC